MNRLLRNDLEAEVIMQEADATRIEQRLKEANLPEDQLSTAIKGMVTPRREAAQALRKAVDALAAIPPLGSGV